jgi:large subunit ribosomal protein L21
MYAVIQTGGKQYRVEEKSVVRVEKLDAAVGDSVQLGQVLMLGGETEGSDRRDVQVGRPFISGASVTARVVRQGLGRKIHGFTYKAKKNVRRRYGHRQPFTEIVVESITA